MTQKIEYEVDYSRTVGGLPAPTDWHIITSQRDEDGLYGRAWEKLTGAKLRVIESVATREDGKSWLHVSVSRANGKMPSYDDLTLMRKLFIGEDKECYMIFPTKERYVNINPNVLHLYCCLDQPDGVLPHMEGEIGGILSI